MNTKRNIISEVEQMAVNAIVHQPDDKAAAEKHFSETAKKIVETAMQAIDIMEIGDICRRAVTGAAIQDYDLLAKLLTDKDFDHDRLAKSIEALASERPIDYPTFYTPGWLGELAKKMETEKPTDAELHEAATEEPTTGATGVSPVASESTPTGKMPIGPATLPPGADGTPPAEERNPDKEKAPHIGYGMEVVKTPQTVVMRYTIEKSGRTISAELFNESTSALAHAFLYDEENCVCQIKFFNRYQGRCWAYGIVRKAMNGLISKAGKRARNNSNRKAKAVAGASRPGESEVA